MRDFPGCEVFVVSGAMVDRTAHLCRPSTVRIDDANRGNLWHNGHLPLRRLLNNHIDERQATARASTAIWYTSPDHWGGRLSLGEGDSDLTLFLTSWPWSGPVLPMPATKGYSADGSRLPSFPLSGLHPGSGDGQIDGEGVLVLDGCHPIHQWSGASGVEARFRRGRRAWADQAALAGVLCALHDLGYSP